MSLAKGFVFNDLKLDRAPFQDLLGVLRASAEKRHLLLIAQNLLPRKLEQLPAFLKVELLARVRRVFVLFLRRDDLLRVLNRARAVIFRSSLSLLLNPASRVFLLVGYFAEDPIWELSAWIWMLVLFQPSLTLREVEPDLRKLELEHTFVIFERQLGFFRGALVQEADVSVDRVILVAVLPLHDICVFEKQR